MYQSLLSLSAMFEVLIQSDVEQIKSDGGKENNAKMLRKSRSDSLIYNEQLLPRTEVFWGQGGSTS